MKEENQHEKEMLKGRRVYLPSALRVDSAQDGTEVESPFSPEG